MRKHEARLSNISGYSDPKLLVHKPEIESLASRTSSAALQLRFAQNDSMSLPECSFHSVFRLGSECFQERHAGKGQSAEQISERKRRVQS